MKIEIDQLNEWARLASQTNGKANRACFLLSRLEAQPGVGGALAAVLEAQATNNRLLQELLQAGADDPDPPAQSAIELPQADGLDDDG